VPQGSDLLIFLLLRHLDLLLLSVLAAGPRHGYAIISALRERSGGTFDLPEGTVYPALHRLEDGGLLASSWADVTGRRRRVYGLTDNGARTCAVAHMLEASSDAVVLRASAGIIGVALLVVYGAVRYLQRQRRRGPVVVLGGYFPLLAAGVFGAGALGLAVDQLTGFGITQRPGTYLSAIVAAAAAAWYGRKARPAFRHLISGRRATLAPDNLPWD
jgi:PadR family transcriptional regulator, regulatory protein PadR